MARRTIEQANETRENLIAAGISLFATDGYDATSAQAIADKAHVTRGALYHHFEGGKKGLFANAVERMFQTQQAVILEAAGREQDAWSGICAGCQAFLRFSLSRDYQRIVMLDAPSVLGVDEWHKLDRLYTTKELQEALQGILQEENMVDTEALAEALSGSMNQLSLWAAANQCIDRAENTLLRMLNEMIKHPSVGSE